MQQNDDNPALLKELGCYEKPKGRPLGVDRDKSSRAGKSRSKKELEQRLFVR